MDIKVYSPYNSGYSYTVSLQTGQSYNDIATGIGKAYTKAAEIVTDGAIPVGITYAIDKNAGAVAAGALGIAAGGTFLAGGLGSVMEEARDIWNTATVTRSDSNGGGHYMRYNGLVPDIGNGGPLEHSFTFGNGIKATGSDAGVRMWGTAGNDTIFGGRHANVISAGSGNDNVKAGAGNDNVNGNGGKNFLWGQAGKDTITLNNGDNADGGTGEDTFIFYGQGSKVNNFYWNEDHLQRFGRVESVKMDSQGRLDTVSDAYNTLDVSGFDGPVGDPPTGHWTAAAADNYLRFFLENPDYGWS